MKFEPGLIEVQPEAEKPADEEEDEKKSKKKK
jgi:hypothetical protein